MLTVERVLTGGDLGLLSGFDDLLKLDFGGQSVLYGFSRAEGVLTALTLDAAGEVSFDEAFAVTGNLAVGSRAGIAQVTFAGGDRGLAISGLPPSAGQVISLESGGEFDAQISVNALGTLRAPVAYSFSGAEVVVTGGFAGGLVHYSDVGTGFGLSAALDDDDGLNLADVAASVAFEQGGVSYMATLSENENGVALTEVSASGLTARGGFGTDEGLPISMPEDLAVMERLDETILVVASSGTSSLSALRAEDGALFLADHVFDGEDTRFAGAASVAGVTSGDFAYVAVAGAEDGLSVFTVLPGGRFVHLASLRDDETRPLDQVSALEMDVADGTVHIYAGSVTEPGLAHLEWDISGNGVVARGTPNATTLIGSAGSDQLIGADVGEALLGGGGADILLDGAGEDTMTGGAGSDVFLFAADGVTDWVTDFERGVDRLDLSGFDFLYGIGQVAVTETASGATLSFGDEVIEIASADGLPLGVSDFSDEEILNVDRPPSLLIGREIMGGGSADYLTGGAGGDTMVGGGGNDSLAGQGGDDSLNGGDGDDVLYGDDWF